MWIVFESRDGSLTLLSEKFGVSYHSKYGALQESLHVFIKEGLFHKCLGNKELNVLEMGFGTGLNALLTSTEAIKLGLNVQYTAIEQFPIDQETIEKLNYCEMLGQLNGHCVFPQLHKCPWGQSVKINEHFTLLKQQLSFEEAVIGEGFDLIYFDAFAPSVQPALWEAPMMEKMFNALNANGVLVTYCAQGGFKRALKDVGFEVKTLKGPPGKREMVRAVKNC